MGVPEMLELQAPSLCVRPPAGIHSHRMQAAIARGELRGELDVYAKGKTCSAGTSRRTGCIWDRPGTAKQVWHIRRRACWAGQPGGPGGPLQDMVTTRSMPLRSASHTWSGQGGVSRGWSYTGSLPEAVRLLGCRTIELWEHHLCHCKRMGTRRKAETQPPGSMLLRILILHRNPWAVKWLHCVRRPLWLTHWPDYKHCAGRNRQAIT